MGPPRRVLRDQKRQSLWDHQHEWVGKKYALRDTYCRVTEPTQGRAVINGRFCGLLEVGTGFHPELTGRDNVYMSGAILRHEKHQENPGSSTKSWHSPRSGAVYRHAGEALFQRDVVSDSDLGACPAWTGHSSLSMRCWPWGMSASRSW